MKRKGKIPGRYHKTLTDDGFIVSVPYLFQFLSNLFPQPE